MRKFDKNKNMDKANLLAEQIYLKSKGFIIENDIHEYDYEGLSHKYSGLPQDKKDSLVSKGKERQMRDGIKLRPQKDSEIELFALGSDFWFGSVDFSEFKAAPIILNILTKAKSKGTLDNLIHDGNSLRWMDEYGDLHKILQVVDIRNIKYHDEIKLNFEFSIRDVVTPTFNKSIDISGKMIVKLSPLNDKHKPPFSMDVSAIHLEYNGIEGRIIPSDRKSAMKFVNVIKEKLTDEYGKFDLKKPIFIQKINIHPNALIQN